MQKNKIFKSVHYLTLAAMLTAVSVVIGIVCKSFLNFGGGLFRITFENLPIILSGLVMGPAVGGLVGAATDLISYMLSPQIYPPNLIVTAGAATVGIVSGFTAKYLFKERGSNQIIFSAGLAHALGSMIIKPIGLYSYYGILVLWRIPLYLIIAPLEIALICMMYKNAAVSRVMDGGLLGDI